MGKKQRAGAFVYFGHMSSFKKKIEVPPKYLGTDFR